MDKPLIPFAPHRINTKKGLDELTKQKKNSSPCNDSD